MDELFSILSKLYLYTFKENNNMSFSNKLKDDNPDVWGIENGISALKLKVVNNKIIIIAIINQTGTLGFGTKVIDILHYFAKENNYNIIINNDESGGFWKKIIKKYNDGIISINENYIKY